MHPCVVKKIRVDPRSTCPQIVAFACKHTHTFTNYFVNGNHNDTNSTFSFTLKSCAFLIFYLDVRFLMVLLTVFSYFYLEFHVVFQIRKWKMLENVTAVTGVSRS